MNDRDVRLALSLGTAAFAFMDALLASATGMWQFGALTFAWIGVNMWIGRP